MLPLVSILIPAFNAERWIGESICSALDQTWPNKEVIVVDDGSLDQTASIARSYISSGVSFVAQPNAGAAATRNSAFGMARGDFIQWLDADDLLAPDKIEKQLAILIKETGRRSLISSEWARFIYRPGAAKFVPTNIWCNLSPVDWMIRKLEKNVFMQTATWLISRELAEAAGEWDTRMLSDDDGEYFCRVILASAQVLFCKGSRVYYRSTPANRLSQIGLCDRKKTAQFLSLKLHVQYIRSLEESPRVRAACLIYLQNWMFHFYPERGDLVRELEQIAESLDGNLSVPSLSGKYSWIIPLFGWRSAKYLQIALPRLRHALLAKVDKALSLMQTDSRTILMNSRLRCTGRVLRSS